MWFIRILLLIIIFLGGVYVGNVYVPQRDMSSAVVVAVPQPDTLGVDFDGYNYENAQKTLAVIKAALTQRPDVFPPTASAAWCDNLNMTLALQNYQTALARYEAAAAKNKPNAAVSPEYVKAAADFAAAKKTFEKYIEEQKTAAATPAQQ